MPSEISAHASSRDVQCDIVAPQALVILVAGITATWFAAGSTGLLGHGLQCALTWIALIVALLAARPCKPRSSATWAILAGSVVIAACFLASTSPSVHVFAVALVLGAIAQVSGGLTARVALIAALAAGLLAILRFACDSIPTVCLAAEMKGWVLGSCVGWIVRSPLRVGATFGGLDFLAVMTAVLIGWLVCTPPPRRFRAIAAALAIIVAQFAYLAVLAYSAKILAMMPNLVLPPPSDISDVGIWTVGNGLRMLFPWNVPLLAVLLNGVIVVVMFRSVAWIPVVEFDEEQRKKLEEKEEQEEIPGTVLAADMLFRFGPPLLAIFVTLMVTLAMGGSSLKGKKILAYEKGYLNWEKPEYDSKVEGLNGMLPVFVESLGGRFATSKDLSQKDLDAADLLILLHPDEPWPKDMLERIWQYVRNGGSLLLAADAAIHEGKSKSSFNDVLLPTAMHVREDTAVTRTGNWEQSYQLLSHPATAGLDDLRNRLGFELGSSIRTRWPACPVVVGRWGWSDPGSDAASTGVSFYETGERLGDLVLAAEQSFGRGRIFVLGGASPLRNEMLANSYPFVGRLLGYLANHPSSPQAWWRQLFGLFGVIAIVVLVALRPSAWQVVVTSTVMSFAILSCTAASAWSNRVLPDGRSREGNQPNNVAYIDASHLEAFSSDLWTKHGPAGLIRTLMRQGYFPLLAPDLSSERLERAAMLVSIAPSRSFTALERGTIQQFVGDGGIFISLVGAEDARAGAPLLADFEFLVAPSPVGPGEQTREPAPLGAKSGRFDEGDRQFRFYAAWPVECTAEDAQRWSVWTDDQGEKAIVVSRMEHNGVVVVIGDTHFACNENLESEETAPPDNVLFWRWLFSRVLPGLEPWNPPTEPSDAKVSEKGSGVEKGEKKIAPKNNKKNTKK